MNNIKTIISRCRSDGIPASTRDGRLNKSGPVVGQELALSDLVFHAKLDLHPELNTLNG